MALKSGRVGIHPSQVDPITGMLLSSPGGASDLSDLNDVSIDNPEIGQLLVYDGDKWENQFASISPVTPSTLASLQDVNIDNAEVGQLLVYDGNKWENQFASISPVTPATLQSLQDVLISSPASGQTLEYDGDENKWVNVFASISPMTLSQLQDVVITDLQDNDYLMYDSTEGKWINSGSAPGPVVPEGSTVTPTDDIQTWLACASIFDKTYTTLNQVLADSTTLLALISSNNASDYLVRSTTWASGLTANSTAMTDIGANNYCANTLLDDATWCNAICNSTYFESVLNVKVPTMTSNTTPSGEVLFDSSLAGSGGTAATDYYKVFNGVTTDTVGLSSDKTSAQRFGYDFGERVKIYKVGVYGCHATGTEINCKMIATDDTTWNDIASFGTYTSINTAWTYYTINSNSTAYQKWAFSAAKGTAYSLAFNELQFYGR